MSGRRGNWPNELSNREMAVGRRDGHQARWRKDGTYFGRLGPALVLALVLVFSPIALSADQGSSDSETGELPPGLYPALVATT